MPAAIGSGTFEDIMSAARPRPDLDDNEFGCFENAIAENRKMRREVAEGRGA
jgi:hypothetical protein